MTANINAMYDVIVIGGGIAGLVAAREFGKNNIKTLLLEAQNRLGGRICAINEDHQTLRLGGEWIDQTHILIQEELRRYNIPIRTEELAHCWAFPVAHSIRADIVPVSPELQPMLDYIFQQIDIDASRLYALSGLDSSAISSFDIPWTEYVAHHLKFNETPEVKHRMATSDSIHAHQHQPRVPVGKGGSYGHHHMHATVSVEDVYQPIRDFLQAQTFAVIKGDLNQTSALYVLHYIHVHGGTSKVFLEQRRFHFDSSLLIREIYKEIQEDLSHVVTIQTKSPILTMSAYEFDPYSCEYNSDRRDGSEGDSVLPYYMTVRDTNHRNYIGKKVLCTIPSACYPSLQFIPPLPPSMLRVCENANVSKYYKVYLHVENIPQCHKMPLLEGTSPTGSATTSRVSSPNYRGGGVGTAFTTGTGTGTVSGRSIGSTRAGIDDISSTGYSSYNHVVSYPNRIIESLVVHPEVIQPKLSFGVLEGEKEDEVSLSTSQKSVGGDRRASASGVSAEDDPATRLFDVRPSDVFLKHNSAFDMDHVMETVEKAAAHGATHGHKSHAAVHAEQNTGKLHFHGHGVHGQHAPSPGSAKIREKRGLSGTGTGIANRRWSGEGCGAWEQDTLGEGPDEDEEAGEEASWGQYGGGGSQRASGKVPVEWDESDSAAEAPTPCVFKGKFSTKSQKSGLENALDSGTNDAEGGGGGVDHSVTHLIATTGNIHRPNTTGSAKIPLSASTKSANRVILPTISGSHPTLAIALSSKDHHPTGGSGTGGHAHTHSHQHHETHARGPSSNHQSPLASPLKMRSYHLASTSGKSGSFRNRAIDSGGSGQGQGGLFSPLRIGMGSGKAGPPSVGMFPELSTGATDHFSPTGVLKEVDEALEDEKVDENVPVFPSAVPSGAVSKVQSAVPSHTVSKTNSAVGTPRQGHEQGRIMEQGGPEETGADGDGNMMLLAAALGEAEKQEGGLGVILEAGEGGSSALPSAVPSRAVSQGQSVAVSAVPSAVPSRAVSNVGSISGTGVHTPLHAHEFDLEPIIEPSVELETELNSTFPGMFEDPLAYNDMLWAMTTGETFGGVDVGVDEYGFRINQESWDYTGSGAVNSITGDSVETEEDTSMLMVLLDATSASEVQSHETMFHDIRKHYPTCKLLNFTFYDFNRAPYSRSCQMCIKAGFYRLFTEACIEALGPWYYVRDPPGTEAPSNPMGTGGKGYVKLHVDDGKGFSGFGTPTHKHKRKPPVDRTQPLTSGGISTLLLCSGSDFSPNYSGLIEGALETTYKCIDIIKQQVMAPPDVRNFIKIKKNHLRPKYR